MKLLAHILARCVLLCLGIYLIAVAVVARSPNHGIAGAVFVAAFVAMGSHVPWAVVMPRPTETIPPFRGRVVKRHDPTNWLFTAFLLGMVSIGLVLTWLASRAFR